MIVISLIVVRSEKQSLQATRTFIFFLFTVYFSQLVNNSCERPITLEDVLERDTTARNVTLSLKVLQQPRSQGLFSGLPRFHPLLCQPLVAGRNSGIMKFI